MAALFLLALVILAAALSGAAYFYLRRGHVPRRAAGLSATFFAGALVGFFTAFLAGSLIALALESDGLLGPTGAAVFLLMVAATGALCGALCVMGMSRILKWKSGLPG
ncbi:putative membrane protein [Hyphomonas neptunium ATCC 15444]|uniref:Uncharacterized protein n=2 Tax=Hyphomonas TaxID=85 RepID=A0A059FTA7_9PROT|nr:MULTISPECIES: hypothetical protein [Hyphomonas]ABI75594.1 putative membrane protein [Hyphomonas neptunium ATCC 15444]KCZ93683.1 hypothetical protein HHI_09812 [Hyphomonas hirschiana VP5]